MRLLPLITILLAVIGIALALTIGAMSGACARRRAGSSTM